MLDYRDSNVHIKVDFRKFHPITQKAQYELDTAIMDDMEPYMPMDTSYLIQRTRIESAALAGTGVVCAASGVYGRYLYEGKKMVNAVTGKGPMKFEVDGQTFIRWPLGSHLVPTDEPLNYLTGNHPLAQAKWFEAAKRDHLQEWIERVQKVVNDGA